MLNVYVAKSNYKKGIVAALMSLLVVAILCTLSDDSIKMAMQDSIDVLMVIRILLSFTLLSLCIIVFLVMKNRILWYQVKYHAKLAQELRFGSEYDAVSGLKNRNCFARLSQSIEKQGMPVSVLVCDIDGLKIINDTLGHLAGDIIIRKASEILRENCPANADIFRMGGDEFILIIREVIPDVELENLHLRLKSDIEHYNRQNSSIPLSFSIGFAVSSVNFTTLRDVIRQADFKMYQEKRACQEKVYNNLRAALVE